MPILRASLLPASALLALAALCACRRPTLKLDKGESAILNVALQPGITQMIEVDLARVAKPGAELGFSAGGVLLPATSVAPAGRATGGRPSAVASWLWSGAWPMTAQAQVKVANYGPGEVNVLGVRTLRGSEDVLYSRSRQELPLSPIGWFELRELMERATLPAFGGPDSLLALESSQEYGVQPRRREAFKAISGLPLAIRLAGNAIPAGVEIRACSLDGGGAIVGYSRPDNPYQWKHFGPGWLPAANESQWIPFPAAKGWTRGFEIKDTVCSLAFVAGSPDGAGALQVRLYRIDSVAPLAARKIERLPREGTWIEFKFDRPMPPGDWVLEAQAIEGAPGWLAWNRPAQHAPGSEWPELVETLAGLAVAPEARLDTYIPVQTLVAGSAVSLEKTAGRQSQPKRIEASRQGAELLIEGKLFPGETEIYYLRDYRPAIGGAP